MYVVGLFCNLRYENLTSELQFNCQVNTQMLYTQFHHSFSKCL